MPLNGITIHLVAREFAKATGYNLALSQDYTATTAPWPEAVEEANKLEGWLEQLPAVAVAVRRAVAKPTPVNRRLISRSLEDLQSEIDAFFAGGASTALPGALDSLRGVSESLRGLRSAWADSGDVLAALDELDSAIGGFDAALWEAENRISLTDVPSGRSQSVGDLP